MLDCGRRFGKDIIQRNYASEGLLAGEPVAWYEPEYKSLQDNWTWFVNAFYPMVEKKSEQGMRLDLVNGGYLEMWSLQDKDASRGRHYKRVVINEAAKVPHLQYSWDAVIRITLMDLEGGAMFGSTPRGLNFFWQLFRKGEDPQEPEWTSFKKTTYDNPYIPVSEIEKSKQSLPELIYRQEIEAEFIDDSGGVFRRVQEAAHVERLDEPLEGRTYIAGVDVAAAVDYTVVCILDSSSKELVHMDRFNRVDYNVLEDRLAALYERFKLSSMTIEVNSIGQGVIDHLAGRGMSIIPFQTTNATKQTAITSLQAAFEHSEIGIINDPVLIGELLSFESKRNPSGSFSYSAPEGMHDDTVMALAIAWQGVSDWFFTAG